MTKEQTSTDNTIKIVIAVLGVISAIGVAYFTYRGMTDPVKLSLGATQTAEAKLLAQLPLSPSTLTPTLTPAETTTSTLPPLLTPTPIVIVDTSTLMGWVPDFNRSKADIEKNKIETFENAIKLTYELGVDGFVILTKGFDSRELLRTKGISFVYSGMGEYNTLEFKLLLRYPAHEGDTTYGIIWRRETNTDGKWVKKEVPYTDLWCWGPSEDCTDHPEVDITKAARLDFAVSNKPGDDPGPGWIQIKDVLGISP
jgi:hypothetical protein